MESTSLDPTDFRILNVLVANGRISFADLGKDVGLSPHGAADRVRRLERAGVINGFTAVLDLANVGRSLEAFIDVALFPATPADRFERNVLAIPAVQELMFVTGSFDYHVRVACLDTEDLDHTVRAIRAEGVARTETRIILRSARAPGTIT